MLPATPLILKEANSLFVSMSTIFTVGVALIRLNTFSLMVSSRLNLGKPGRE